MNSNNMTRSLGKAALLVIGVLIAVGIVIGWLSN